jgi:hypothetical protein
MRKWIFPSWFDRLYDIWFENFKKSCENIELTQALNSLFKTRLRGFKRYTLFLKTLRKEIKQGNDIDCMIDSFYQVDKQRFWQIPVDEVVENNKFCLQNWEEVRHALHHLRETIIQAPWKKKVFPLFREWRRFKSRWSLLFNPLTEGNFPHTLFLLSVKGKKAVNIRMGSPTQEYTPFLKGKVNPEFKAFIRRQAKLGKTHLYFNFQARKTKWISRVTRLHDERERCRLVESLDGTSSVTVCSLSKDSDFYFQKKKAAHLNQWSNFKKAFIFELLHSGNCFLSPSIEKTYIESLLEEVHLAYFKNAQTMNIIERIAFIEIFYLYFTLELLTRLQPDSFNLSCTDCIDRGMSANSLLYFWLLKKDQKTDWSYLASELIPFLFSPALIVRQREIRGKRLERFIHSVPYLEVETELEKKYRQSIKRISYESVS